MPLLPAVLQRLESRLPLDGTAWSVRLGEGEWPQAAVLVVLTDESIPRVLLGRRGLHLAMHPGEVAFPGGKRDPGDASPWVTARREAHEEVGLLPAVIHPLGELSPLITRTGFEVHPCIAMGPAQLKLEIEPAEFDSVFQLPLAVFADRKLFRLEAMSDRASTRMVPHYQVGTDNIWGVTAAILAQLANVAYDAGLELQ